MGVIPILGQGLAFLGKHGYPVGGDALGRTPLHLACSDATLTIIALLLEPRSAINVNARDSGGRTALHFAAAADRPDACQVALPKCRAVGPPHQTAHALIFCGLFLVALFRPFL
jgi:hypothetical protein